MVCCDKAGKFGRLAVFTSFYGNSDNPLAQTKLHLAEPEDLVSSFVLGLRDAVNKIQQKRGYYH